MMKSRVAVIALSLALAAASSRINAQEPGVPTIDQILDKYVVAVGGRAAIEKITSVNAKGTLQIPDAGINGTIELFQKAPDKSLTVVDLPGLGQQREGFDGTVGWASDPQNGVREKAGLELTESKRASTFPRETQLKTLFPTMTVKGKERVGTRDAVVVEATPAQGAPVRISFDISSGLILRQITSRQTPQGPIDVDVTFDDYRAVDGIQRAHTIRQQTTMFTAVITLTEVKHNVQIDDAVFRKPSGYLKTSGVVSDDRE